jgi:prolipoprotein diacylglyceryl transferase
VQIIEAAIPSPTVSVIHLGPLPIHIYALCIVAGIIEALVLTDRRWRARGGKPQQVGDVAGWAVLFGIIGGRLYHVITDPELYFEKGRHPIDALKIWDGGLGIWGAVALGALGAYIGCRRHGLNFVTFADAVAPGILIAQGVGRLGNWFNNELYGRATTLPWKLQIHDLDTTTGNVAKDANGHAVVLGYFQPTFVYELIWNLLIAAALLYVDRRYRLGRGNVFALYVMGYTFGRFWIESLRSDHANHILGMRVNNWVSILVFLAALAWFVRHRNTPRSHADDGATEATDASGIAKDGAADADTDAAPDADADAVPNSAPDSAPRARVDPAAEPPAKIADGLGDPESEGEDKASLDSTYDQQPSAGAAETTTRAATTGDTASPDR